MRDQVLWYSKKHPAEDFALALLTSSSDQHDSVNRMHRILEVRNMNRIIRSVMAAGTLTPQAVLLVAPVRKVREGDVGVALRRVVTEHWQRPRGRLGLPASKPSAAQPARLAAPSLQIPATGIPAWDGALLPLPSRAVAFSVITSTTSSSSSSSISIISSNSIAQLRQEGAEVIDQALLSPLAARGGLGTLASAPADATTIVTEGLRRCAAGAIAARQLRERQAF